MSAPAGDTGSASAAAPEHLFPLIRHLSTRATTVLARTPLTANQITALSLLVGLAGGGCMLFGEAAWDVAGGALLVLCYVLDNCDGEIARLKNQSSAFGMHFDTFVDWAVHAAFFAALGLGVAAASGNAVWSWLGWIAAAGGTVNYVVGLVSDMRGPHEAGEDSDSTSPAAAGRARTPAGWKAWTVFAFRELSRADFCFIVLALALFDAAWVLLPLGAVGAQVYWLARFVRGAADYHV